MLLSKHDVSEMLASDLDVVKDCNGSASSHQFASHDRIWLSVEHASDLEKVVCTHLERMAYPPFSHYCCRRQTNVRQHPTIHSRAMSALVSLSSSTMTALL